MSVIQMCLLCHREHGVLPCKEYCATCVHARGLHAIGCIWARRTTTHLVGMPTVKETVLTCDCKAFAPYLGTPADIVCNDTDVGS